MEMKTLGQILEFGTGSPLGLFHNTVMERSWPMPEFPISQDPFLNLYLAFEINSKLFLSFVGNRTDVQKKLEANCF